MLKTRIDDELWLVTQPDHARVSGYLAAHWGGANRFASPGYFAFHPDPELIRQEVVQAIAEHDNGWWDWEAAPRFDEGEGLPLGLLDVARRSPVDGLQRWRLGVPRLAEAHPYVALLISLHAYWLYAPGAGRGAKLPELQDQLRHPLFGGPDKAPALVPDPKLFGEFLDEQEAVQQNLKQRLRSDPLWNEAIQSHHLYPHLKLLQLLDTLSLLMCFGGRQEQAAAEIPRSSWQDRVTLTWKPLGDRRILCDPYPFDVDPLEVFLCARVLPAKPSHRTADVLPLTYLHSIPLQLVRFELTGQP